MSDETELEKMERQIEVVIAQMNKHSGIKRQNSLNVLANKFKQLERRCNLLSESSREFTKEQVETAYQNVKEKILGEVSVLAVLKRMESSGQTSIDKATLSMPELVCISWGLDNGN